MKYVKIMGLAAIAAMALMAVVAASASANAKVCSTSGTGVACNAGHGNVYTGKVVAKVNASGTILTMTNPDNWTLKCSESVAEGEITNGSTGTGKIIKLTFGTCSSAFCFGALSETSPAGWPATATTTTAGVIDTNGIMDVTINGNAIKFVCTFPQTTCEYSATTPQVHIKGSGAAPQMVATNISLTKTFGPEFTCGTNADWSGTYNVTTPVSLFIE